MTVPTSWKWTAIIVITFAIGMKPANAGKIEGKDMGNGEVAPGRNITSLSAIADAIPISSPAGVVVKLMGSPDYVVPHGDHEFGWAPKGLVELVWANGPCSPIYVHIDLKRNQIVGIDVGRISCKKDGSTYGFDYKYPIKFKCPQPAARWTHRFCK